MTTALATVARTMATETRVRGERQRGRWLAATTVEAMRVASNEEGEGAGRATTRAMTTATTVVAMRVASDKEGEGGKAMEMVTRLAGTRATDQGGSGAKKSRKKFRRHHLKQNVPSVLLRICVFVFESKKSQP